MVRSRTSDSEVVGSSNNLEQVIYTCGAQIPPWQVNE